MANSIMAAVSRFLTPELVGKLASATGLDRSLTQTAVGAAVPSILSALTGLVAQPSGARQLANAVAEQPANILASIAGSPSGSTLTGEDGARLLSSLLGGGPFGVLTSTVSKFLGVAESPMRMLLGLLTPLIMGVLGREQRAAGLDAGGLGRLLTEQKAEIAAAMPAGLSKLLETNSRRYEAPGRRTSQVPTATTAAAMRNRGDGRWRASWPYWVLPLLALAGLLWYLFAQQPETAEPVATSPAATPPVTASKSTSEPTRDVQTAYLSGAPDNWVSIGSAPNDYVNKDTYNGAGDQLGTIKDVLVGPDGKMAAAIINVGRYLGIGDKEIAVSFSALHRQQRESGQRIVIDTTKEALQAAPTFVRPPPSKR